MKKASIDNQTQRSLNEFSWEQLIINGNLVISISATNADEKTIATKTNKQKKTPSRSKCTLFFIFPF